MSKPMVVTLPCVLLLLDYWPLNRLQFEPFRLSTLRTQLCGCRHLLLEKAPFFALSLLASIVTYEVQKSGGAVASFESNPFGARVANAVVAYPRYLLKTVWPVDLSVFYPLPDRWPVLVVIGGAGLLLGLSFLAVNWTAHRPYVLVGWFWFVGTLVPAIGLIQVGSQSMADRYMYIPSIGLFVILAWGLAELSTACQSRAGRSSRVAQPLAVVPAPRRLGLLMYCPAVFVLVLCGSFTAQQITYWRDEEALFRHAMQVCPDNYLAYDHLAKVCESTGRKSDAESYYLALLKLKPRYPQGQYNLGTLEMELGNLNAAAQHLNAAVVLRPEFADAHCNLGLTLFRQHRLREAAEQFGIAGRLAPQNMDVRVNLGVTFLAMDAPAQAAESFGQALILKPDSSQTHFLLALALSRAQKPHEAIAQAEQARALALSTGQPGLAAKASDLLKVCRSE